jgi:hypothetical protein
MQNFELRNSPLLHLLSGVVLFAWVGLLAMFIREAYGPVPVFLYYAIAVFSFIGLNYIVQGLDKRVQVRIDPIGLVDRRNGFGVIPWAEVSEVQLARRRSQWLMTLNMTHPEYVAERARPLARWLHKVFSPGFFTRVKVPLEDAHVTEELRKFLYSVAGASDMPVKLGQ